MTKHRVNSLIATAGLGSDAAQFLTNGQDIRQLLDDPQPYFALSSVWVVPTPTLCALVVLVGVWALLRYTGWDADAVYWIQYSRHYPSHRGAYTRIRHIALIGAFAGLAAVVGLARFCPRRSHLAVTQRHPLHVGCAQASRRPTSA